MRGICRFSGVKGGDPSGQASLVSMLPGSPSAPELEVPRKANHMFQRISLSNATLFFIVFFACSVRKLNYIKNDFVLSIDHSYYLVFFLGLIYTILKKKKKKKELKENY